LSEDLHALLATELPQRLIGVCLVATALCLTLVAASTTRAADLARVREAATRQGPRAVAALPALLAVMQQGAALDEEARLAAVNSFFNRRIVFADDATVWGQPDFWASPLEALDKGQGDCEDFVIAKYFTLLSMGLPVRRLRLVYVRAQIGGESVAHMVLAHHARPDAEPLILDNLITSLRSASRRPDLTPVFSFNSNGLWQGVGSQTAGDPRARLSRWHHVLAKAKAEGFF
jgi:predicted transglutaminase-like cysteine proteinase